MEALQEWLDHLKRLEERRHLEVETMRAEGTAHYGRALEMYALDRLDQARYEHAGIHSHCEKVVDQGLEVSQQEYDLCVAVNQAIAAANQRTSKARKLEQENLAKVNAEAARGFEAISEDLAREAKKLKGGRRA